jgi:hypothetical protein
MVILLKHEEILTDDERWKTKLNFVLVTTSISLLFFVQLPLTWRYIKRIRADPEANRHLRFRILGMPLLTTSLFLYGKAKTMTLYDSLGDKYLSGLSDT